jgi:hypothetical protein
MPAWSSPFVRKTLTAAGTGVVSGCLPPRRLLIYKTSRIMSTTILNFF